VLSQSQASGYSVDSVVCSQSYKVSSPQKLRSISFTTPGTFSTFRGGAVEGKAAEVMRVVCVINAMVDEIPPSALKAM